MILAFLYIILALAEGTNEGGNNQVVTISAKAKSTMTVPAPPKEVSTVTVTVTSQAECKPNTSTSTTGKKETLCVKCYDKLITPDCKKCVQVCDDGTKVESFDNTNKQCPNKPSEEVPCACKDPNGRVVEENFYKTSNLPSKAALVEDAGKLSN